MKNWGYSITEKRSINLDDNDMTLSAMLEKIEPSVKLCIGCGGCTATCSAGVFTTFNFRRMHHLIRRGEYALLEKEISKCMLCGKCSMVCPRGVNTRNVSLAASSLLNTLSK